VLAGLGLRYDSSIFPVRHDRYGVPDAPRTPFVVRGHEQELLEFPLTTWRLFGQNLPAAGGGYFRLFPLYVMERGIRQATRAPHSGAVLYFHPWEFDPEQPKLPLAPVSKWRTYVGTKSSRRRFETLLSRHRFGRIVDLIAELDRTRATLPRFPLALPAAA
jgi:hypothetical protein